MSATRARRPPLPEIDPARCDACGACVRACLPGALAIGGSRPWLVHPERCDYCGACEAACPTLAIACPYEVVLRPAVPAGRGAR